MNLVVLEGHLGNDPELRTTTAGTAVANFSLATNSFYRDKDGNSQKKVEWHKIVVWGKMAENVARNLTKGRSVSLQGHLQTRKWEDKDKNTRYTTEIVAERVNFGPKVQTSQQASTSVDEREIPFAEMEEEQAAEMKAAEVYVNEQQLDSWGE